MTPDTGVFPGVPISTYHSWDAASNSRLTRLKRSPAHLKAYLDQPPEQTHALVAGRAIHAAVLEPTVFAEQYVQGPPGDRRTKAVKAAWAELEDERGQGYVLKPDDYAMCLAIRDSVCSRRSAAALLGGDGDAELSLVWRDRETGILCKGRYDRLSPKLAGGTVVDLKSTRDASRLEFERSIFTYGYHRQGAFYLDGGKALGLELAHYTIIAVEKDPPYEVGIYRLTEGAIDAGRDQLRPLIDKYAACQRSGDWPGYPDHVFDISLPPWAWNRITEELEMAS